MKSLRRYFRRRKNDIRRSRASGSRSTPIKTNSHVPSEAPQLTPPLQQPSESSTLPRAMHPSTSTSVPGNPPVLQQPDASLINRSHPNAFLSMLCEQAAQQCDSSWQIPNSAYFNITGLSLKSVGQLPLISISHGM